MYSYIVQKYCPSFTATTEVNLGDMRLLCPSNSPDDLQMLIYTLDTPLSSHDKIQQGVDQYFCTCTAF